MVLGCRASGVGLGFKADSLGFPGLVFRFLSD